MLAVTKSPKPTTMHYSPDLQHLDSHPTKPYEPLKHSQIMERFKVTVFKLANSKPTIPLNPSQIALVEKGLLDAFSSFKTPSHPPYSAMIEEAIKKLDSEGSLTTENIISEYIIKSYEGLPWGHNRYLKHHLGKLCESGELDCDIYGSYIIPGQKKPRSSRPQVLKRKLLGRKKEDMVEDGNLGREEVNELSDSQVGCQEEASQGLGRGKRKRRRSYVFDDEENEVVESRVTVREGNTDSGSEIAVIETQNELLLLKGREILCKSNEIQNEDHGHVGISEGKYELELDIECAKEVKSQVVEVDRDLFKGTKEPESVLPENVMKSDDKAMKLDDSHGANLMGVPVENLIESNLLRDHHKDCSGGLMLVPFIESDATGSTVEKLVLKEITPNPSARDLMIVPYVDNQVNPAIRKEMIPLSKSIDPTIVCGLTLINEELSKPKKKLQVYQQRRRSKPPQEKPKALREELMLASLDSTVLTSLETKVKQKYQSPKSKGVTLLEDSSVKQLQRQRSSHPISHENICNVIDSTSIKLKRKSQSPKLKGVTFLEDGFVKQIQGQKSSHTINLENISIEDEEPLCQVMEKCGNLKRHGMQEAKLKVASPLASSKVGAQLPNKLHSLENFAEMTPRAEKESALTKRIEKHLHVELGSQDKSQHDVEHQREDNDGKSLQEDRHHVLKLPLVPVVAFVNEILPVVDELPQKPNKVDHESPLTLIEATPENEKEKQLHRRLRSQDKSQHEVERQREDNVGKSQQEVTFDALEKLEVSSVNGKWPLVDQLPQKQNNVDQESPLKLIEATPESKAYLSDMQNQVPDQHAHQLQLENSQPKKRGRGRPPKSEKATKNKKILFPEPVSDSSNLQLQNSQKKKKSVKQDGPMRTRKQRASKKDEADLLEPNLKEQKRLSGTESSRNKSSEKVRRGNSGKVIETVTEPMDLYSMHKQEEQGVLDPQNKHRNKDETIVFNLPQKEGLSEPATRSRGRPPKIKNEVTKEHLEASLKLDNQQEVGLSEQVNNQETQNKKLKRGRPKIQKEGDKDDDHDFGNLEKGTTKSGADPSNLQCQEQVGLKSASHAILEASSRQSQVDLKESLPETSEISCPNFELSEITTSEASSLRDNDQCQPRRRITRSSEAAKTLLESQNCKQHDVELSGQLRLAKPTPALVPVDHHCPDKESEDTENEVQVKSQRHKDQEQEKSHEHDQASENMEVQARESLPATNYHISPPDLGLSAMTTSEASTCLADKSSQRHKDQNQPRRMSTRSSEAAKTLLESQNGKQPDVELSDQRRAAKLTLALLPSDHHCPDKSEDSEIEDHGKPVELEQPEESHDCDQTRKKMEVQVNLPKEISAKNVSIKVPLSSKDQLRSRMKRQSQDA